MVNLSRSLMGTTAERGVTIATRDGSVEIAVAESESSAVRHAVEDLVHDLRTVSGATVSLTSDPLNARIVVGTLQSSLLADAIADGVIDVSGLLDEDSQPRWEAFQVATSADTLYLIGADHRGTIYAIYDFTEALGVSPWYWWGGVAPRSKEHVSVQAGVSLVDWPSVQYRGVFINDEEELDAWARAHTPDGTIGPHTYRRLYELILRLKGNYLWPAMHVGAFNTDPENGRLAHEMGLVIGASHCDMLLRSNEHEFRPWADAQDEPVAYDYSIPGRNRDKLREYWRGSIEQNGNYDVTWPIGMRGIHDTGFQTTVIDDNDDLDDDAKFRAKVHLLEEVIADQRRLLSDTLGTDSATLPQIFIPYKEVLPLYDAGLHVPEDVTLVWTNDNFGYVRRFPNETELERRGGHGLYYHSSYWSDFTKSYLATSSTPLALMKSELEKAWAHGIRRLWVDNIGGLKPLEQEMEYFLRTAWDAGRAEPGLDVQRFTADWVDEKFSGGHGSEAADIYTAYYQLNNQRKYEHLTAGSFPQVGYGDEAGRRLSALKLLYQRTNRIIRDLPRDERDTFVQLFAVKIHMAYLTNAQFYHADRSTLSHAQGKLSAADRHLALSRTFNSHKRALIHAYNHELADGVWSEIFTPESFPPPVMPLHPAGTPALRIDAAAGLGVVAWGDLGPVPSPTLRFSRPAEEKWIEIFTTGAGAVDFTIDADPWIKLSHTTGRTDTETRVTVCVDPDRAHTVGTIRVTSLTTSESVVVTVHAAAAAAAPADAAHQESDGYISMDPATAAGVSDGESGQWMTIPHLGRYVNHAMRSCVPTPTAQLRPAVGGVLEFPIVLETAGRHVLHVHRHPTLNATGRMRVGISVDDHPVLVAESPITDEHRGAWHDAVQDNIDLVHVELPHLDPGPHTLRLHTIDDGFTLSKLVVNTRTPRPTNLGPVFTAFSGAAIEYADGDPTSVNLQELADVAQEIYRVNPAEVPPLPQIYAGPGFWDGDTTFRRNLSQPQTLRTARTNAAHPDGTKDLVVQLGTGAVAERDGVIAFEAATALADDASAWRTSTEHEWSHTQADTTCSAGLAMHVRPRGLRWDRPDNAPGLHYRLQVVTPGVYHAWFLVKFDDAHDDAFDIALDGTVLPPETQFSGGEMCTYGTRQVWLWALTADLTLDSGEHTLSLLARKSGLRIHRVYLTTGDELPPTDARWAPSQRLATTTARALATAAPLSQP